MSTAADAIPREPPLGEALMSPYGRASVAPSAVSRMMAAFAADFRDGADVNLGVGFVNEATLPRRQVGQALAAVLADPVRYRTPLNYGGPAGSANLVAAVRRWLAATSGASAAALDARRLLIGPNGATSLLESLALVLRRGIAVVADPMYYIYTDYLRRLGYDLLPVPEDDEGLSLTALVPALEALGERLADVAFVYVVTVHNPTGTILSNRRRVDLLQAVADLSRRLGRRVPLIVDRAYEDLVHDPDVEPGASLLDRDACGIVYEVGTLSKILAPALRIGYVAAPAGPLADALVQRTSDAGFSAPLVNQEIAAQLLDACAAQQVRAVNAGYRAKARAVAAWIGAKLGDQVEQFGGGRAGFYYYLTLRDVDTGPDSPFFRYLSRTTGDAAVDGPPSNRGSRVAYIPGSFCVHPAGTLAAVGRRQLRISYGYEELDRIALALDEIAAACAYARRHP